MGFTNFVIESMYALSCQHRTKETNCFTACPSRNAIDQVNRSIETFWLQKHFKVYKINSFVCVCVSCQVDIDTRKMAVSYLLNFVMKQNKEKVFRAQIIEFLYDTTEQQLTFH